MSYSHKDVALVYPELVHLDEQGFNVWYDQGISPGHSWSNELAQAILGAHVLVFFGTQNAADSRHCVDEISFALDHGIPVLAAYLSETDMPVGMKLRLNTHQAIFRRGDNDELFRTSLLRGVSNFTASGSREQPVLPTPTAPRRLKTWHIPVVLALLVVAAGVGVMLLGGEPGTGQPGSDLNANAPVVDQLEREAFEQNSFVITHQTIGIEPFSAAASSDMAVARDVQRQMSVKLNEDSSVSVILLRPGEDQATQPNYLLQGDVTTVGDTTTLTLFLLNSHTNAIEWSESYPVGETFDSKAFATRATTTVVRFFFIEDHFREEYLEGEDPEALRLLSQISRGDIMPAGAMVQQRWKAIARLAKTDQLHDYAHFELANYIIDKMDRHEADSEIAHAHLEQVRNKQSTMYLQRLAQLLLYIDLNYAESEKTVLHGIEASSTDYMWYVLLARIAHAEGRQADAVRWLNTALGADLYGDTYFVLIELGMFLLLDGSTDQAISFFDQADALVEGSADFHKILALAHAGRLSKAEILLERMLEVDLSDPSAASLPPGVGYYFIRPLIMLGQLARGHVLLQGGLAQMESSQDVDFHWIAEGYFALGDMDRGFEFLERAIRARSWWTADSLRSALMRGERGHDPRYNDMLALLESVETHTEKYRSVASSAR